MILKNRCWICQDLVIHSNSCKSKFATRIVHQDCMRYNNIHKRLKARATRGKSK